MCYAVDSLLVDLTVSVVTVGVSEDVDSGGGEHESSTQRAAGLSGMHQKGIV